MQYRLVRDGAITFDANDDTAWAFCLHAFLRFSSSSSFLPCPSTVSPSSSRITPDGRTDRGRGRTFQTADVGLGIGDGGVHKSVVPRRRRRDAAAAAAAAVSASCMVSRRPSRRRSDEGPRPSMGTGAGPARRGQMAARRHGKEEEKRQWRSARSSTGSPLHTKLLPIFLLPSFFFRPRRA
ncbi:uncharacterized protein PV09_05322 [Verruconis gallopava]|uniref:Uncharacterized protein n=1 Tax=Verruconis gallopava TaxID=253628 RepID=A0A0D1YSI2_9PEZI|nr:uncharacterized protein PV09_05322 [Verruconis gallopava]KIW03567.1 hypothetical protein PV09_05322 [Verruconis gallopava]